MRTQLRHLVAAALYPTKAYNLPAVCERYGLDSGSSDEAFSSKNLYVMSRLEKLSDEKVLGIARNVVKDFPDDNPPQIVWSRPSNSMLASGRTTPQGYRE
jgi:hypothetical protein